MRISCDSDHHLAIEHAEPPSDDLRLLVEVRCPGFTGRIDTWVLREAWIAFAEGLAALDERRQGEAIVESITPQEFRLVVRSTDSAGHMAIEGLLGYRGVHGETLLTFSPMSFDPSSLPALVLEARAIAG